jgi:hypothetical protein
MKNATEEQPTLVLPPMPNRPHEKAWNVMGVTGASDGPKWRGPTGFRMRGIQGFSNKRVRIATIFGRLL